MIKKLNIRIQVSLLVTLLSVIFSCKDNKNFYDTICENKTIRFNDTLSALKNSIQKNDDYIELKNIESLSDTFILRIEYYDTAHLNVFEFNFYKDNLHCIVYKFPLAKYDRKILFDKSKESNSKYAKYYKLSPKDDIIAEQLNKLSILKLPSSFNIVEYPFQEYSNDIYNPLAELFFKNEETKDEVQLS